MQKVPETLALQTMKQTLCRIIKKLETLINTGFLLGNTWQHPKIPKSSPSNIAETPENAASALPEASLGEDKYLILSFAYNPIIALWKKFIHRTSKKNLLFHENIIY